VEFEWNKQDRTWRKKEDKGTAPRRSKLSIDTLEKWEEDEHHERLIPTPLNPCATKEASGRKCGRISIIENANLTHWTQIISG
jgi:hypothetical protein